MIEEPRPHCDSVAMIVRLILFAFERIHAIMGALGTK